MSEEEPMDRELAERRRLLERPSRARYDKARHNLERRWRRRELKADRMMREVVDELWDQFAHAPYSWCGFYLLAPSKAELVLGPHRDKPACSPLPLTGVCGKALASGKPLIVPDVTAFDGHIECDPRNLSEICLPVFDKNGKAWAVFDVDSAQKNAFDEMDERWLQIILSRFSQV